LFLVSSASRGRAIGNQPPNKRRRVRGGSVVGVGIVRHTSGLTIRFYS
jgi:hypothetical protein